MTPFHSRRSLIGLFSMALVSVAACSTSGPATGTTPVPTAQTNLAAATDLGVRNAVMPVPGLVVAGQITQEQFDGLAAAGFTSFISLRGEEENGAGWEEEHAPTRSVSFERLHIAGAGGLSRDTAEELDRLLKAAGEGTVLYCGSGNRAGSLLALKSFFVDGMDADASLELGRAAGMTGLETRVKEIMGSGN
jgi:uncharacterized protein (TIGR01244 family)